MEKNQWCLHSFQPDGESRYSKPVHEGTMDETLTAIQDKLAADHLLEECTCIPIDNLMEMLTLCVDTTYFGMGSDIYQQEGLAMGLPLFPELVNINMEYFEGMALGSISLKPSLRLRYEDH